MPRHRQADGQPRRQRRRAARRPAGARGAEDRDWQQRVGEPLRQVGPAVAAGEREPLQADDLGQRRHDELAVVGGDEMREAPLLQPHELARQVVVEHVHRDWRRGDGDDEREQQERADAERRRPFAEIFRTRKREPPSRNCRGAVLLRPAWVIFPSPP